MAQLKTSTVIGSVNVTAEMLSDEIKINKFYAPTESGSTTYGVGADGQVLKSNGVTVYWGADSVVIDVVTGIKGDNESSYRTGQVNITPENIGAVAIAQGSSNAGKFLTINSSGNVVLTAI